MSIPLPSKIEQKEIPLGKRWDTKAVFVLETERIKAWVEQLVNNYLAPANATFESVKGAGATANSEVMNTFGTLGEQIDQRLLNEAEMGNLEQAAPQEWRLLAYGFLKWVTALAEVLIFVWSALIGMTNYFVITVGVMLAVVGWILGLGISRLAARGGRDLAGWAATVFGMLGILLLSLIRAGGEFEGSFPVIVITVIVALMLAIFTALEAIGKEQLGSLLRQMFICQRWKAAMLHSAACERGHWKVLFEQELERLAATRKKMQAQDNNFIDQTFNHSVGRDAR